MISYHTDNPGHDLVLQHIHITQWKHNDQVVCVVNIAELKILLTKVTKRLQNMAMSVVGRVREESYTARLHITLMGIIEH